jgi:hypothetical protein
MPSATEVWSGCFNINTVRFMATATLAAPGAGVAARRYPRPAIREPVHAFPWGLALGDLPGIEQVELDFPHDVSDAGLAWFPGREVSGFP